MERIFILFVLFILSSSCAIADEVLDVKLPPDYKIIIKNQDFPVTLRPLVKNGTFRVVNYQLFHKEKLISQVVENVQIIDSNKVVFKYKTHDMHDPVHVNVNDWINYSTYDELYQNMAETFYKYVIVHGKDKDYLLYMINFPTASDRYPYYCIGANQDNTEIIEFKQDYKIFPSELDITNPKVSNNIYQLIDDKYIIFPYFDGWFSYSLQFEIKDDELQLVDNEYKIEHYSVAWYDEPHEIVLYPKPFNRLNAETVIVKPNSNVKILGIRYGTINYVHVIINGKEGWIEENDSQYIGVGRAG